MKPTPVDASAGRGDFSLVLGGPLYQLLLRLRLVRPPLQLLYRRLILSPLLAWVPLLVLAVIDGRATGRVAMPFLSDIGIYARFLVAMPLLILAEPFVHYRLRNVILQFDARRVVPPVAEPGFDAAVASAMRLRDSMIAEAVVLFLAFVVSPPSLKEAFASLHISAWHSDVASGKVELTRAGWWFVHVSAPMFQFLLMRWYFRLLVWWRLLWQLSRLPLDLKAVHADRAGGLGFLGDSISGLIPILLAQGALVSGFIADRILAGNRRADEFIAEIALVVVLLVAVVIGPLLFFSRRMLVARRDGLRRYGALCSEHADGFEDKWLGDARPADEALVGSPDVSSLADLGASCDVIREMRPVPFDLRTLFLLVAATAVPFLPLALTEIPLRELVNRVLKMMI